MPDVHVRVFLLAYLQMYACSMLVVFAPRARPSDMGVISLDARHACHLAARVADSKPATSIRDKSSQGPNRAAAGGRRAEWADNIRKHADQSGGACSRDTVVLGRREWNR